MTKVTALCYDHNMFSKGLFLLGALFFAQPAFAGNGFCFLLPEYYPFFAVLGLAMIAAEMALPTKGALGVLGTLAFIFGTISLADYPNPTWRLDWGTIILINILVVGTVTIVAAITIKGYLSHDNRTDEPLLGQTAKVVNWTNDLKRVELAGAVWLARTTDDTPLATGQHVIVRGKDNLTLLVEPLS